MSTWMTIVLGILGIIASAAVNIFVVGVYIGTVKGDLKNMKARMDEMDAEDRLRRELLANIRERLRWCESRLNGVNWRGQGKV